MGHVRNLPISLPGLLSAYQGVDQRVGQTGDNLSAVRAVGVFLQDAGSTDTDIEIRSASGALLTQFSMSPGQKDSVLRPVFVQVPALEGIDFLITSAGIDAAYVSGYVELEDLLTGSQTTLLTTLALVGMYLTLAPGALDPGSETATKLAITISEVSERMETYMRRRIGRRMVSDSYDAMGNSDLLQLRTYPADGQDLDVTLNGDDITADCLVLEGPGHLLYQPGGVPQCWPAGRRHIAVASQAGYESVPEDIQNAATTQVAWQYKRSLDRLGERDTVLGEGTATYMVDAWAPEVLEVMDRRRAPLVS